MTTSTVLWLVVKSPDSYNDKYSMNLRREGGSLTVRSANSTLTGSMDNGFQTERLIGVSDTVGYVPQYYPNGMMVSPTYAFNYVVADQRRTQAYAYLLGGQSLEPDSLHNADSLTYYSSWKLVGKPQTVERYKLEYGSMDNRYQTVDVNQLLLGMDVATPAAYLHVPLLPQHQHRDACNEFSRQHPGGHRA